MLIETVAPYGVIVLRRAPVNHTLYPSAQNTVKLRLTLCSKQTFWPQE